MQFNSGFLGNNCKYMLVISAVNRIWLHVLFFVIAFYRRSNRSEITRNVLRQKGYPLFLIAKVVSLPFKHQKIQKPPSVAAIIALLYY